MTLWLLGFLVVAGAVITRQRAAIEVANRLRKLRTERVTLEARRADLERRIQVASSRSVLIPLAERRLGLHLPSDSEFVIFRSGAGVPSRPDAAPRR